MPTLLLYRLARALLRLALRLYFRKIEVSGADRVPASGPIVLAANHPQSVVDGLVLGYGAGRMLHYLGHSGLFENRMRAWFLRNTGVIPIHRRDDTADASHKNVEMFAACRDALQKGDAIGIFPEGMSGEGRRLHRLRTGAARIALESEAANAWRLGVTIVPAGLSFESARRFRSRVLVSFGRRIQVADYRDAYREDPVGAVNELTDALQEGIRQHVVSIEQDELDGLVREVERLYMDELVSHDDLDLPGQSRFERSQVAARGVARALHGFYEQDPERVWQWRRLVREYRRKLERVGLTDETIRRYERPTVPKETVRFLVLGALGLPFALYGAVWNWLPYRLTGILAVRIAADDTKIHTTQLLAGAILYLLYYPPLLYLAYRILGLRNAAIFAVSLLPFGLYARGYTRRMMRRSEAIRLAYLGWRQGYLVQSLRLQRDQIVAEIERGLQEYLAAMDSGSQAAGEDTKTP